MDAICCGLGLQMATLVKMIFEITNTTCNTTSFCIAKKKNWSSDSVGIVEGEIQPELCLKIQSVPRSKHRVSVIQTSQLMLHREIIAVCSQIHTKHINTAVWAERRIGEC